MVSNLLFWKYLLILFFLTRGEPNLHNQNDYMRRTGKGLINYLAFRNKRSENKQKARFYITDITKKYFRKLRKRLNHSSYPGYKSKKFHNELMEAYFFLIKNITKLMKIERHVRLHTNFVKSGVNEKIGHVNGAIQSD